MGNNKEITNSSKLMLHDPFPYRFEFALRLRHVIEKSKKPRYCSSGRETKRGRRWVGLVLWELFICICCLQEREEKAKLLTCESVGGNI